jgi:2-amino-4-hydroxy-6-hydroxymethyldihydropteridine diphosphokinase
LPGLSETGPVTARAYVGLGGNLGDPKAAMAQALRLLVAGGDVELVAVSSLYRTPAWGKTDQPDFLNAVAKLDTRLSPRELLARLLEVEAQLKRVRRERWGPRVIDMDLLIYGTVEVDEEGLKVPHPRMAERAFVMVPLAEIAPDQQVAGRAALAVADELDTSGIKVLSAGPGWLAD